MIGLKEKNNLVLPFILNLTFTIFEFIGGILTNSIALISDSIHDIGDSISIGVSLLLHRKSKKPSNDDYTYGYKRFSLLGGLISSLVLVVGSVVVIYEAIPRLLSTEDVKSLPLLLFAVVGVSVNLFAAIRAKKGTSINERVISLHLFEDAFGWIALLVGAVLMELFGWYFIDPILSILFTLYILTHVYSNLKQIISILMEVAPEKPTVKQVKEALLKLDVLDVHHIHLWTMNGEQVLATLHITLKCDISREEYIALQDEVREVLEHLEIVHPTVEYEFEDSPCERGDCAELLQSSNEGNHHHHHHHH